MDLFVIEAPMKARTLENLLARLGFSAKVQATKGHFFRMPESLEKVGIDSQMREFARKGDLAIIQRLRAEAQLAENVIIATDADSEGDVIAWDVAECIRDIHPEPLRVRLKALDDASVKEAIDAAVPVSKADAVAGRTRAIVDRMIGAAFSKPDLAVGRVGTAILGMVDKAKPSVFKMQLVAPAKDGGRPWMAEASCSAPFDEAIGRRLVATEFPMLAVGSQRSICPPPGHTGDVMVRAVDQLDMSPLEASDAMQNLYEVGRLSYPRAGSRGMSLASAAKVAELLRKAGYNTDPSKIASKPADGVHDSPHPIGKVDLSTPPGQFGHVEGVRTLIARDLVKSGQTYREETAVAAGLIPFLTSKGFSPAVAEAVAALNWRRESGPRYPGQNSWPRSELIERRADAVVLEMAVEANLGRPSTWGKHIERFMSRGLIDGHMRLTGKGRSWLGRSPAELLDPRVSAAIEMACERPRPEAFSDPSREPWEVNAERIVKALPPALRQPLQHMVSHEPPRPKIDPIEAYGLNTSVMDEIESRTHAPAYVPQDQG